MGLFKAIHENLRDRTADKVYAHLRSLGIEVEMLHGHPLQKVGAKISFLGLGTVREGDSLGLVQVVGKSIRYVNVIREQKFSGEGGTTTSYFLEYLVPLGEIPLRSCWAELHKKKRFLFWGGVTDVEWRGGSLAETLNGDLTLKQSLLTEFRVNRPLGIEIVPEPIYRCARISTRFYLPLRNLFDCLDRVAGLTAEYVTEVNSRPEEVLFEAKVELNTGSKDAEVTDCCVTDRQVLLKSREPLQVPLYWIEDCHYTPLVSQVATPTAETRYSTVAKLTYRVASGNRKSVEFAMSTHYHAWELRYTLSSCYPRGISR